LRQLFQKRPLGYEPGRIAAGPSRAHSRRDVAVRDTYEAARSVVAEMEGQVLFTKLGNSTRRLDTLCENSLALLGPRLDEHVTAIF
jgi:TetR/AcrR family transcriptional repressor of nem operon